MAACGAPERRARALEWEEAPSRVIGRRFGSWTFYTDQVLLVGPFNRTPTDVFWPTQRSEARAESPKTLEPTVRLAHNNARLLPSPGGGGEFPAPTAEVRALPLFADTPRRGAPSSSVPPCTRIRGQTRPPSSACGPPAALHPPAGA